MNLQAALAIGSIIFSAGGFVMAMRMTRKDVNGLGRKVREQDLWRFSLVRALIEEASSADECKRYARLLPSVRE